MPFTTPPVNRQNKEDYDATPALQLMPSTTPMPSIPVLRYILNAFLVLYLNNRFLSVAVNRIYAQLILNLTEQFVWLNEQGKMDSMGYQLVDFERNPEMYVASQKCYSLFLQILELFPGDVIMPNVIAAFQGYLKGIAYHPNLVVVGIAEQQALLSTLRTRERRLSDASTSSEASYIVEYLASLSKKEDDKESVRPQSPPTLKFNPFSDDEEDNEPSSAQAEADDAASPVLQPTINLPRRVFLAPKKPKTAPSDANEWENFTTFLENDLVFRR
ncbi:hypothetical protein CVT24_011672 [Panaeolus cyanescens]|uniref:Uncharacterized protein n=1 Tax=Panaeolus cyanescens TaxID=181874 RepID=A0A409YH33_9AGAR|nr:hypothetical protein CVT24_011672 [Panaeolus cyanescens]